jgi:hypothetical protein
VFDIEGMHIVLLVLLHMVNTQASGEARTSVFP